MTRLRVTVWLTIALGSALCLGTALEAAADSTTAPSGGVVLAKKHRAFADKLRRAAGTQNATTAKRRWRTTLDRRVGKKPPALINIYNGWTHEYVTVPARGTRQRLSAREMNSFLRCRFTNETTSMDPRLFDTLVAAARHFRVARIDIISAYRSPKYNLLLRKKGRQVARASRHTMGKAVDFRLPGISTTRLHKWVVARALGGVGKYLQSEFIHIDTDKIRYWEGR